MADSAQKFVARNRAPRVQIEYDVELYGAEKKVQLPFVMGVLSDLVGQSQVAQPAIADRKFLEIDVDTFDERMRALAPRAAFSVPNTLTGEGNLSIDLTFESMTDFTPGAVAAKVEALRPLLEARQQLEQLMTYMDGKTGAESLIETVLTSPALLSSLAGRTDGDAAAAEDALASLRRASSGTQDEAANPAGPDSVLAALAAQSPADVPKLDEAAAVLSGLKAAPAPDEAPEDKSGAVLQELASRGPQPAPEDNETEGALASLKAVEATPEVEGDAVATALSSLASLDPIAPEAVDNSAAALASLVGQLPEIEETPDHTGAILSDLAATEAGKAEADQAPGSTAILADLAAAGASLPEPEEDAADVLAGLERITAAEPEADLNIGDMIAAMEVSEAEAEGGVEDILAGLEAVAEAEPEAEADLGDMIAAMEVSEAEAEGGVEDILAGLEAVAEAEPEAEADLDDMIAAMEVPEAEAEGGVEDILAGLEAVAEAEPEAEADLGDMIAAMEVSEAEAEGGVEDILAGLEADVEAPTAPDAPDIEADGLDLDDLLADLDGLDLPGDDPASPPLEVDAVAAEAPGREFELHEAAQDQDPDGADADPDLDGLLAGLDLGDAADTSEAETGLSEAEAPDLDALLADLDLSAAEDEGDATDEDLDALFSALDEEASDEEDGEFGDLDALLDDAAAPETDDDDLDALLNALEEESGDMAAAEPETPQKEPELAYGTMTAIRPEPQKLNRKRFRIAVFGDFTGRAARGLIEVGRDLAARKPIVLDPDTFEEVIEGFATELVLPIGKDGAGISVNLGEFDDLHPDELFDKVALFSELTGLRKQLQSGVTQGHTMKTLAAWAEAHGTPARAPRARSGGNAVPADLRLSDFQRLIGDTSGRLRGASPIEDLLARVVGPHIHALPDANLTAMQEAVDEALSDAMRLVLHHPEFQSVEAQWRSLDLIQRSIEVDDTLDIVLYDVSAEELAADLAAQEDLSESGFVKLLTEEPMDPDNGRGAYSALIGLYTFEETPPHAELLGRFARVAAHVDAPFLASITPGFWDTAKEDRPKIVAEAWDTLRGMAEAGHLGLLTPRFLLRRPYGARSEPIDPFDFEEFTASAGLRSMLWGNPVVLAAILMAKSFKKNGASLQLGSIMSLGDMPFHYVKDRFGDQVALPCTERNVDLDKIAAAKDRGFMPIASVRGRDEIRLTSFNSLRGDVLLGPWTGQPAPAPSPADPRPTKAAAPAKVAEEVGDDLGLDDLGLDLDLDDSDDGGLDDLDALLAGFGDDDDSDFDGDMDADLEALLNDL